LFPVPGLAALSVVIRPTAALTWLYVGLYTLAFASGHRLSLVLDTLAVAAIAVSLSCGVDRTYYGQWVFVPWEFVKFNLGHGSEFYGSHPWHWNFSQGFPVIMSPVTPLLFISMGRRRVWKQAAASLPPARALFGLVLWVNIAMSLPAHKEFRFLLPALPVSFLLCGQALYLWAHPHTTTTRAPLGGVKAYRAVVTVITAVGGGMAVYFSQLHQRGGISAMSYVGGLGGGEAHFLTPCHSSPARHTHTHTTTRPAGRGSKALFLPPGGLA